MSLVNVAEGMNDYFFKLNGKKKEKNEDEIVVNAKVNQTLMKYS